MASAESARYDPNRVAALVRGVAGAAGLAAADAALFADALVEADVQGTSTHGVSRLAIYVKRIRAGLIDPKAELRIDRERAGVVAFDACNGLGQVQTLKALDRLEPIARKNGVAAATIRNSQHFGAASVYCNRMAARDLILFATTNSEPAMAPEGAYQAYFGTNPIAASFPTGGDHPVKIDLATSIVARGNIISAEKQGKPIPEGWALTKDGEPTTDAKAAFAGTVLTMAGHKGYALALMVEIFSGVLSGAAVGGAIGSMYKNMDRPQNVGHFLLLLDVSAFMDVAEFKRRMDAMNGEIRGCKKRPGVREVLVPGDRSHRTADESRRKGIALPPAVLAELRELAASLKVPFELAPAA